MFLELHLLQNFAPSNLNRDDTGAPKDCEFGGFRRARISSQCLKRAIRMEFRDRALLPAEQLAERTKRLLDELVRRLVAAGRVADDARQVAAALIRGLGLGLDDEGRTQYLLFVGRKEVDGLADLCLQHWDEILAASAPGQKGRAAKQEGKAALPARIRSAALAVLDGGRAVDVALFGRMIADLPERAIDAASQVAHAISTNRVAAEFDFFTAVDDLRPEDNEGAGMLGTVEFNSACFYRYANIDFGQLVRNLGGDQDLARDAALAFIRASVHAVPTGKQNSTAAQNPPSLVFAVLREHGLWSLANAFLRPVRPGADADLMQNSIAALDSYWARLSAVYGSDEIVGAWVTTMEPGALANLASHHVPTIEDLVSRVSADLAPGSAVHAGGDA